MFLPMQVGAGLLRYEILPGEPVDEFSLEMLRQNPPKGVLRLGREVTAERDHLLVPVAGLIPLSKALKTYGEGLTLRQITESILKVKVAMGQQMVPEYELLLRTEYAYYDPEKHVVWYLCLPTMCTKDLSLSESDFLLLCEAQKREAEISEEAELPKPEKQPPRETHLPKETVVNRLKHYWQSLS